MTLLWAEHAARQFEPPAPPRWPTPGALAQYINPKTVQTPALDLIDEALVEAFNTPDSRLIISMPPQEGKSVRVAGDFPVWWLQQRPDSRGVVASYGQSLANRNGRQIRRRIVEHAHELGIDIAQDNGAVHDWTLAGGYEGGILSVGVGAGLTGRPADFLIIDDPIKDRKEADSEVYRDGVWDWWTDTASSRLAPGAPVILILTRWHHDDLAGRLLAAEDGHRWKVLNIPAQADHRPEMGQVDPLGREPGEFMVSARGRTREQWEARKVTAGPRTWAALYQGHPTPDAGDLFPEHWARYDTPMWIEREDGSRWVTGDIEMAQSWDMTFKDTKGSDYVVGQVWCRIGVHVYLLDQVRARLSFTATIQAMLALSARWPQAVAKFVEDKANGPAIINILSTRLPGLIPVEPEGSKYARANAVSPLIHSRNVVIPTAELLPNVEEMLEEARGFPNWAHDDTIDAMSQGVNQLLLLPILGDGAIVTDEDFLLEDFPSYLAAGY